IDPVCPRCDTTSCVFILCPVVEPTLRSTSLPWDGRRWPAWSAVVCPSHPLRDARRAQTPGCASRLCASPCQQAASGDTSHGVPLRRHDARDGHGPFLWIRASTMDQSPGRRDHVSAVALTRGGPHNLDRGVLSKDEQLFLIFCHRQRSVSWS